MVGWDSEFYLASSHGCATRHLSKILLEAFGSRIVQDYSASSADWYARSFCNAS